MAKFFGTDGIRGKAGIYPLNDDTVFEIGQSAAGILKRNSRLAVIGTDTRASGDSIARALTNGMLSAGIDVAELGVMTTPGVAFLTRELDADFGVAITASHNPANDNGIKLFSHHGFKISDDLEGQIENAVVSGNAGNFEDSTRTGTSVHVSDAADKYAGFVKSTSPHDIDLSSYKIILDCANGAASEIAPQVFGELGAQLNVINNHPDGQNINLNCGAAHTETLSKQVLQTNADVGISLDGDADRAILIDELGKEIDGDRIMTICALDMHASHKLANNAVVTTVMSNYGMDLALQAAGIRTIRIPNVGDKYVAEAMSEHGVNLGGEQSGHIIFSDLSTTGDGLITAIQVLRVLAKSRKKLSALTACMRGVYQLLRNVPVRSMRNIDELPKTSVLIKEAQDRLAGSGGILVRYSGTEPLLRIMIQGKDESKVEELMTSVEAAITEELGN